jgi:hypothetical protein
VIGEAGTDGDEGVVGVVGPIGGDEGEVGLVGPGSGEGGEGGDAAAEGAWRNEIDSFNILMFEPPTAGQSLRTGIKLDHIIW